MATIKVKTFSVVRDVIGSDVVEVKVEPPATVKGLFDRLFEMYGEPLKRKFYLPASNGNKGEMVAFLMRLNDEAITSRFDMDRKLKNGDELAIIFPVGGG
jgi:molybdopterin converting factor small subunit